MPERYRFGHSEIRPAERQLLVAGAPAALGARAFDLLVALVERRDRVVSKTELFDAVWPGLVVEENNLQVQVSSLRKLLGPQAIATVPGRGYRFVAALDSQTGDGGDPASEPEHNLPHRRTRFIGREDALAQCTTLLGETRLLTLSGIGGCGKTRLALEIALRNLAAFPDGVWFVDLGPLQDAERVAATIAATVGVQAGRLADRLRSSRALIVMDNCEHVVGSTVAAVGSLLETCASLKVLATSREVLGLDGEQVYAVRSLSLPASTDLDAMRRSEAVRLFVDHARLVVPEFEVDEHNASAIAEICRRLDGIALAIELAAARVRVLSVDAIRARLDDRFRLLTGGSRALPRHQTLQATMQWSHDPLTPAERSLFRRLAVFAGGCTLAAAAQVAGEDADELEVLERLTSLHDKSLVLVDRDSHAQPRYRMLETVRQYAEERLIEAGEGDDARDRHLEHFVALGERAAPELDGEGWAAWWRILKPEQENLLAAHAWCANAADGAAQALRLTGSLWRYWAQTTQPDRGHQLAVAALDLAADAPDSASLCRTLTGRAAHALRLGRYDDVARCARRCLPIARRLGDTGLVIDALYFEGAVGPPDLSWKRFEEAAALARATGDGTRLGVALMGIGELHRAAGEYVDAEAAYRAAIEHAGACHDQRTLAVALNNLTCVLLATRRPAEALACASESRALQRFDANHDLVQCSLDIFASLASAFGDHARAARFHGASERTFAEAHTRHEPVDATFIDALMAESGSALGDAAFATEMAAGWALGFDAAVAEADAWLTARALEVGIATKR